MSEIEIEVRFFAAARAAAAAETETLRLPVGTTVLGVVDQLAARGPELAKVLARCSYLVDGVAVRDKNVPLSTSETLDVLPPFAGG
ncbi:MoaD/ThiS family protein [Mycolicibacterium sp. A43C]